MNASRLIWEVIETLPEGPVHDPLLVCATVQVIDWCDTVEQLERVARHLRNEKMAPCDRAMLRSVYRIRMAELRDGNQSAGDR